VPQSDQNPGGNLDLLLEPNHAMFGFEFGFSQLNKYIATGSSIMAFGRPGVSTDMLQRYQEL